MLANQKYNNLDLEFWANVKLLNQRIGYYKSNRGKNSSPEFVVPTTKQIIKAFRDGNLKCDKLISGNKLTQPGQLLIEYFEYRKDVLNSLVEPNLMLKDEAKTLFYNLKKELNPKCPLPYNKQSGEKKDYAFYTGIINMILEKELGKVPVNYDPRELTLLTNIDYPIRTFSRRVDGAFPSIINPIAIWEIKEYYYTTTFGSRVADGVYETQLDGWELWEANKNLGIEIKHYLFIDDYNTWWNMGKSYLCRLIDSVHMGLVTEVVFGKEVRNRLPIIVSDWLTTYNSRIVGSRKEKPTLF